jgi:hypothetical protein
LKVMRWAGFIAVGMIVAACSSTTGDRTSLSGAPRSHGDDDDDVKGAVDAGPVDAAPVDAGPVQSDVCKVGGLALCFGFDGAVTDGSSNALKPKIANIELVKGKDSLAASFGPASQMTFEPNQAFELPKDAATVEAWIRRQSTGADAVVFDDDGRFSLTITATGKVVCGSSGGAVTGTTDIAVEDWAHVACVVDKGEIRAYVNGKEDAKGPGSIGSAPKLGAAIGQDAPTGQPYYGLIDSFRLLWLARSADEIATDAK